MFLGKEKLWVNKIVFHNKEGTEVFAEYIKDNLNISEAKKKFDNSLLMVSRILDFKPGKYSKKDAGDIVNDEGLGYAIDSYTRYTSFKSKKLAVAWLNAKLAIDIVNNNIEYED